MSQKLDNYYKKIKGNKWKVFFDGEKINHIIAHLPEIFEIDDLIIEFLSELRNMAFDLELKNEYQRIDELYLNIEIPFFEKGLALIDYVLVEYTSYIHFLEDEYDLLIHKSKNDQDYLEIEDLKDDWEKRDLEPLYELINTKIEKIQDNFNFYKKSIDKKFKAATFEIESIRNLFNEKNCEFERFLTFFLNYEHEFNSAKEISELAVYQVIDIEIPYFLKKARANGIKLDLNYLKLCKGLKLENYNASEFPDYLSNFLFSILEDLDVATFLDPWADSGSLAIKLSKEFKNSHFVCISYGISDIETLSLIYDDLNIDWKFGQLEYMDEAEIFNLAMTKDLDFSIIENRLKFSDETDKYDIIIGLIPFKDNFFEYTPDINDPKFKIIDKLSYLEMLRYLGGLKEDGMGIFIIKSDFNLDKENLGVFNNLDKFNLYIDSVFQLQNAYFKGSNYDDHNLLIIKRIKPEKIFIGNLNPERVPIPNLIKNWKNREKGKIAELGTLVNVDSFHSTFSTFKSDEASRIASKYNFNSFRLSEIANSINFEAELSNFQEQPNSVYLPLFGFYNSSVSLEEIEKDQKNFIKNIDRILFPIVDKINTKCSELEYPGESDIFIENLPRCHDLKLKFDQFKQDNFNFIEEINRITLKTRYSFEYAQIVLDPEKAIAEYIADLFNTDLGMTIRESLMPKIPYWIIDKSILKDSILYLPDLDLQKEVMKPQRVINDLSQELDSFYEDLIKWPRKNKDINNKVMLLTVGKRFDHWIESLPFPLSSILFACAADSNVEHKVRYLIHFFEALSEFNSTIMLSAITKKESLFQKKFLSCIKTSKYPEWYYNPTFGNWNYFGTCLSKKLRKILNDKANLESCLQMFGNPNRKFLEMLSNKEMYNILKQAALYRNKWLGHGPPVSIDENKARLKLITDLLSQTKQIISYNFNETNVIQPVPGTMSFDGGIFTSTVKVLKGRVPFNDLKVQTTHPLNEKMLYLIHENQYDALEVLPFFKMMESPKSEQNACYFYNSLDNQNFGKEIQLVSYHFDKEAVISRPYDEFKNLISLFE